MIPIMMHKDYSPKGWLGLIMGTRLWYQFWDAESDDDAAFERRLDAVVREIGDRGKLATTAKVPESVPPERASAKAPSPAGAAAVATAPAPAPAPAPALAPAPAPLTLAPMAASQAYTPSMRSGLSTAESTMAPSNTAQRAPEAVVPTAAEASLGLGAGTAAIDILGAMTTLLDRQQARDDQLREQIRTEWAEREEKTEQMRREFEEKAKALQDELEKRRDAQVRGDQLLALQSRLEALRTSKLLSDDEMYTMEDIVVDGGGTESDERVDAMLSLSSRVVANAAFARQLKRRFL